MEAYRSGHNGPDSKSGDPEMGPWVRIPPLPPTKVSCFDAKHGAFFIRKVGILPVPLGAPAILNCEFGAMVQAAQAHDALVFDPDGLSISKLDGGNGTISCAQPAADAGILYLEMARSAHGVVFQTVKRFCEKQRHFVLHKIAAGTILYCIDDTVDLRLCGFVDALHFAFVAQIIQGRPGVRHFHAELRRDGKAIGAENILSKSPRLPRRRAVGRGEPEIIRRCMQRQLLQKLPNDDRQTPGVGRADDSNRFVRFFSQDHRRSRWLAQAL